MSINRLPCLNMNGKNREKWLNFVSTKTGQDHRVYKMHKAFQIIQHVTIVLLIAFPVVILHIPHGGSITFLLLAFLGMTTPFGKAHRPFSHEEKSLFIILGFYFGVTLLSFLTNGVSKEGFEYIELFSKFLMSIPFMYLLIKTRPNQKWLWYGNICGAFFAGVLGLYEASMHGFPPAYRVYSASHWIIFGDLSLAMAFMSIASISYFRKKSSWMVLIPIGAFLCGITASVLSGTRGAWIAVPVLALSFCWYHWLDLSTIKRFALLGIIILLPILLFMTPKTGVKQRLNRANKEIHAYIINKNECSSVGARLGMWEVAWKIFLQNPIIGIGPSNYHKDAQKIARADKHAKMVGQYSHPHNEYLNVLATRGLIGFLALILVFLVPAKTFYNSIKSTSKDISSLGLAGIMLIFSYMQFAITESILYRSPPILFFTFYLTLLTYHISTLTYQGMKNISEPRHAKKDFPV